MENNKVYRFSIRCYFKHSSHYTHHLQTMTLDDIGRWMEAYRFTHPELDSICAKVYIDEGEEDETAE